MVNLGEVTTVFRNVTFSHPDSILEEVLVEHLNLTQLIDHHFDFSNLTQQTTIRIFEKADGVNYKLLSIRVFPDSYDAGIEIVGIILNGADQDMKITLQSTLAEGSAREIKGTVRDNRRI